MLGQLVSSSQYYTRCVKILSFTGTIALIPYAKEKSVFLVAAIAEVL